MYFEIPEMHYFLDGFKYLEGKALYIMAWKV